MKGTIICIVLVVCCAAAPAWARTKLVALPNRSDVTVRLDSPQATLIEEERVLTLQEGVNAVDFSWNGVNIEPDSVRLAVLSHPKDVTLLNVSYPPEGSSLVWAIHSSGPYQARVRISYLLYHIDSLAAYKAVADKAERSLLLKSFLVLRNFSGEDFDQARVVLETGREVTAKILHEETRQILFWSKPEVPVVKTWTFDAGILPWDPEQVDGNVGVPVTYRIKNSEKSGLGDGSLRPGKVRVFQDDGSGGTIFLGEDHIAVVPVGEFAEVAIGDSRDIVVTQQKMRDKRINVRRNKDNNVVLFDTDEAIKAQIENFKDSPAVLTMIQHIPGQWDMAECNLEFTRRDASTLVFEIMLPPHSKRGLNMQYHRRNIRP